MRNTFQKLTVAASFILGLILAIGPARAVTYDISGIDISGDTLTGTIVGDATLSTITSINLVDSQLSSPLTVVQGYGNSILSAAPTTGTPVVTIAFNSNAFSFLSNLNTSLCNGDPVCVNILTAQLTSDLNSVSGGDFSSQFAATATAEVATTPLPAALPLYATGLGALALIRWRRKRKAGLTQMAA